MLLVSQTFTAVGSQHTAPPFQSRTCTARDERHPGRRGRVLPCARWSRARVFRDRLWQRLPLAVAATRGFEARRRLGEVAVWETVSVKQYVLPCRGTYSENCFDVYVVQELLVVVNEAVQHRFLAWKPGRTWSDVHNLVEPVALVRIYIKVRLVFRNQTKLVCKIVLERYTVSCPWNLLGVTRAHSSVFKHFGLPRDCEVPEKTHTMVIITPAS